MQQHGLVYPPALVHSLQAVDNDIPLLPPSQFASLHLAHIVAHPPDHILFPFLHGIEGNNHAQNTFFSSNALNSSYRSRHVPRVPHYRGLVWVVADDDAPAIASTDNTAVSTASSSSSDFDDDEFMDSDDDSSEDAYMAEDERPTGKKPDVDADRRPDIFVESDDQDHQAHMHPVHHRPTIVHAPTPTPAMLQLPLPLPLPGCLIDTDTSSPSPSVFSSDDNSTTPTSPEDSLSGSRIIKQPSFSESPDTIKMEPTVECQAQPFFESQPSSDSQPEVHQQLLYDPSSPPLLTSTFRPHELLRRKQQPVPAAPLPVWGTEPAGYEAPIVSLENGVEGTSQLHSEPKSETTSPEGVEGSPVNVEDREDDGEWEFVPARVPDGISLRNFGIQVPIYATLSDIVVYSPKGVTPATIALARRFQTAIRNKREERLNQAGLKSKLDNNKRPALPLLSTNAEALTPFKYSSFDTNSKTNGEAAPDNAVNSKGSPGASEKCDDEKTTGLLHYNVFILDADATEMRSTMPHLMVRMCGEGVPGGNYAAAGNARVGHAHACEDGICEDGTVASEVVERDEVPGVLVKGDVGVGRGAETFGGAHTDGTDGHLIEQGKCMDGQGGKEGMSSDMDMDLDQVYGGVLGDEGKGLLEEQDDDELPSNTVDFAQREKEEMRDLTKASEIISVFPPLAMRVGGAGKNKATLAQANNTTTRHIPSPSIPSNSSECTFTHPNPHIDISTTRSHWDPRVGQVFLGNSNDVPLSPDAPAEIRHSGNFKGIKNGNEWNSELAWARGATLNRAGTTTSLVEDDPFNYALTNAPADGFGYDICIECHDLAPFPSAAHLRAAEEHLGMLDVMWRERWERRMKRRHGGIVRGTDSGVLDDIDEPVEDDTIEDPGQGEDGMFPPPRPPPHANAVIHLPFPSSPSNSQTTMSALMPIIRFLEKWLKPVPPPPPVLPTPVVVPKKVEGTGVGGHPSARRWSSVSSLMPSFPTPFGHKQPAEPSPPAPMPSPTRMRSFTTPSPTLQIVNIPTPQTSRTRPLKVLIYSSDGYTESSVPALCLLMAVRGLALPEAYLELQVAKRRSFFVYQGDLGVLKRVEGRMKEERERERERDRERERERERMSYAAVGAPTATINANGKRVGTYWGRTSSQGQGNNWNENGNRPPQAVHEQHMGRPAAKSVSFAHAPQIMHKPTPMAAENEYTAFGGTYAGSLPPQTHIQQPQPQTSLQPTKGRPRANTSPWLPSLFGGDHQSWFNDPRFDGSFPSRVLPFLYLGNLNHASNAFMLHALGITHVVSVGECALVPPSHTNTHGGAFAASAGVCHRPSPGAHFIPGKGPSGQGSLWIEEREGRIKVLDIKGVCDDGIDTLEPQLEPICDWIDKARQEGGQVLVHCRVGVSRSATVTIAYVMKHLGLPLVDAYLIVRSRRLSVLIQPNMRLLYNLCGWEIKLAKERAKNNERKLKKELARTLSWPYLAKEVHALNEKYLH